MYIIGIDPGTTTTGYSIILRDGNNPKLIDYGIIETTPKEDLKLKLLDIGSDINMLIKKYNPELLVIEKLFFTNNIKTGIDVSHARGVIIYEFIKNNIDILELTPLELKKGITGNGKANKMQLQNAIKILLKLDNIPKPDDAADAVGLAYLGFLKK